MSTAQDHKYLAGLQDVFGPLSTSSITRFSNGVYAGAAGPQGSEGSQGSAGSQGLQAVNVLGQTYKALKETDLKDPASICLLYTSPSPRD